MKKLPLLILAGLLTLTQAAARRPARPADIAPGRMTTVIPDYVYGALEAYYFSPVNTPRITFDSGEANSSYSSLENEEGLRPHFNSEIDALNFLASRGWELVTATVSDNPDGQRTHYYLMRLPFHRLTLAQRQHMMDDMRHYKPKKRQPKAEAQAREQERQ